jgi:hypothetical protein
LTPKVCGANFVIQIIINNKFTATITYPMRKLISLFLLICLFSSCKEKNSQQLQILLRNEVGSKIKVTLYPKYEFSVGYYYDFCSFISGYKNTVFNIDPDKEEILYITDDLGIEPYALSALVFDSIHITFNNKFEPGIRFSPAEVIGYPENLFSQYSNWTYKKRNYIDNPAQFEITPTESDDYTFTITGTGE